MGIETSQPTKKETPPTPVTPPIETKDLMQTITPVENPLSEEDKFAKLLETAPLKALGKLISMAEGKEPKAEYFDAMLEKTARYLSVNRNTIRGPVEIIRHSPLFENTHYFEEVLEAAARTSAEHCPLMLLVEEKAIAAIQNKPYFSEIVKTAYENIKKDPELIFFVAPLPSFKEIPSLKEDLLAAAAQHPNEALDHYSEYKNLDYAIDITATALNSDASHYQLFFNMREKDAEGYNARVGFTLLLQLSKKHPELIKKIYKENIEEWLTPAEKEDFLKQTDLFKDQK